MNQLAYKRTWGPTPNYFRAINYTPPNKDFITIAGPCSVESVEQIHTIAKFVKEQGATHLRGGVFRAGTYPGKTFGLIERMHINAFADAARENGLKNIIEVLDYRAHNLDYVLKNADCVQVGARQQQNYQLLRILGDTGKTVFLKRNTGCTLDEFLGSAEHLLTGKCNPVLIERGSSTNHNHVRWDLSISMIPAIQAMCKIPIIVDASHGTGRRDLVPAMTLAGVAAGANGVLLEVHPDPEKSLSDAEQAIDFNTYINLMNKIRAVRSAIGGAPSGV